MILPVTMAIAENLRVPLDVLTCRDVCGMVYYHVKRERFIFTHRVSGARWIIASQYAGNGELDTFMDHEFPSREAAQITLDAIASMQHHRDALVRRPDLVGHWR